MTTPALRQETYLLPSVAIEGIHQDQENSFLSINDALRVLKEVIPTSSQSEDVVIKVIEKFIRVVKLHQSFHYSFEDSFRREAAEILSSGFFDLRDYISMPQRLRMLQVLKLLLNKQFPYLEGFSLDWRPFWKEITSLLGREDRYEVLASESIFAEFTKGLASFINDVRLYFTTAVDELVNEAMEHLADLRSSDSSQGLLLLAACLPTKFPNYDVLLPQFMDLWLAIDHNVYWDYLWLKVLSRARKYSSIEQWLEWKEVLFVKLRQLLSLPVKDTQQKSLKGNSFPRALSARHVHFFINVEARDISRSAIFKLAKLLMHIIMHETKLVAAESLSFTIPKRSLDQLNMLNLSFLGFNDIVNSSTGKIEQVASGAVELAIFLQSIRTYFHPNNISESSSLIAAFLLTVVQELCSVTAYRLLPHIIDGREVEASNQDRLLSSETFLQEKRPWLSFKTHWPTLRYIMGLLLTTSLEGLYSMLPAPSQAYSAIIKHLLSLEPLFVHAIIPPMLYTLEEGTSSPQMHALKTIQALSGCFHVSLYPQPIILQYLPEILKLTLPALDPSDSNKTALTLILYDNIFARLSITSEPLSQFATFSSYLILAEKLSKKGRLEDEAQATDNALWSSQLAIVMSYVTEEWATLFVERVFVIINNLEKKMKGVKDSMLIGALNFALGLLFQAMDSNLPQKEVLAQMIIQYTLNNAPLHSVKACAKLLDTVVQSSPQLLKVICQEVLRKDRIDLAQNSNERVAFRLRLAAGCLRFAGSEAIMSELGDFLIGSDSEGAGILNDVILNPQYLHHEEKEVRKAVGKFLKDFFKGCMTVYPTNVRPTYRGQLVASLEGGIGDSLEVLGEPVLPQTGDLCWHIPGFPLKVGKGDTVGEDSTTASLKALEKAIDFLRKVTKHCFDEVQQCISTMASAGKLDEASTVASQRGAKIEENVAHYLKLLKKVYHGVADLLGDGLRCFSSAPSEESQPSLFRVSQTITYTTRESIFSILPPDYSSYLRNYRDELGFFLLAVVHRVNTELPSNHPLLRHRAFHKHWLTLVDCLFNRRMTHLKDLDRFRSGVEYIQKQSLSAISVKVFKQLKRLLPQRAFYSRPQQPGLNLAERMCDVRYWRYHSVDTNTIACQLWLTEVHRSSFLGFSAMRKTINIASDDNRLSQFVTADIPEIPAAGVQEGANRNSNVYQALVYQVLVFSRHEFDVIRPLARKTFKAISSKLSKQLLPILSYLLDLLQPNGTYYQTTSTLVLFNQPKLLAKLGGQLTLKKKFLRCLSIVQEVIRNLSQIGEREKSEKVLAALSDLFVAYATKWTHRKSQLKDLLELVGEETATQLEDSDESANAMTIVEASASVSLEENEVKATSEVVVGSRIAISTPNLRLECFHLYTLLHLIGSPLLSYPNLFSQLFRSMLSTLSTQHGHPTQLIAQASLCRLSELLLIGQQGKDKDRYVDTQALGIKMSKGQWKNMLVGLSSCHPKYNESANGSQWSAGIDQILASVNFLRITKPRSVSHRYHDLNVYSIQFRRETVFLLANLINADVLDLLPADGSDNSLDKGVVLLDLLEEAFAKPAEDGKEKEGDASNKESNELNSNANARRYGEGELRAINATRAEVFGAILKTSRSSLAVEERGLTYFGSVTESIPLDFFGDWQETFCLIYDSPSPDCVAKDVGGLDRIQRFVLDGVGTILRSNVGSVSNAVVDDENTGKSGEGFGRQSKVLMLASSALVGDFIASCYPPGKGEFAFAEALLEIFCRPESNLIHSFSTCRSEIAKLIYNLIKCLGNSTSDEDVRKYEESLFILMKKIVSVLPQDVMAAIRGEQTIEEGPRMDGDGPQSPQAKALNLLIRETVETVASIFNYCLLRLRLRQSLPFLLTLYPVLLAPGVAHHPEIQLQTKAAESIYLFFSSLTSIGAVRREADGLSQAVQLLVSTFHQSGKSSWKLRNCVLNAGTIAMQTIWPLLTTAEKTNLRDFVLAGLIDGTLPEVQASAQKAMLIYLTQKSPLEIFTAAQAYLRNSEILITREKARRKAVASSSGDAAGNGLDKTYLTTVNMMACIILMFPYDLPSFMPAFLTSFLRHLHLLSSSSGAASLTLSVQTVVSKAVQSFKATHQDRWKEEFKSSFSIDQLDALQGAGVAHYFA
eukprot:gene6771-7481_t